MQWQPPRFDEVSLGGEVTGYVNTDDVVDAGADAAGSALHSAGEVGGAGRVAAQAP